jgi:hypothetical protein
MGHRRADRSRQGPDQLGRRGLRRGYRVDLGAGQERKQDRTAGRRGIPGGTIGVLRPARPMKRSLEDFERHYPVGTERPMSGANYGRFQIRFGVLARRVYEADGEAALARLWAFGQSRSGSRLAVGLVRRAPLAGYLARAHGPAHVGSAARDGGQPATGARDRPLAVTGWGAVGS